MGSVLYTIVCIRPNVAYGISTLSRFMVNLGLEHWPTLKWLLRYLKGSSNLGLCFKSEKDGVILNGNVDSNYGGDIF